MMSCTTERERGKEREKDRERNRERESRYLKSLEKPSSATLLAVNIMLEKEKYRRKRKTNLEK